VATELFDYAAERLEQATRLDRLQARGTLRIAMKQAGLEPASLTLEQLTVVFDRILPGELETRGVDAAADTCSAILQQVASSPRAAEWQGSGGADAIFRRLGGD
jgi:hypothetical protein